MTKNTDYRYAIGLMSGTSADGMDGALIRIRGCGTETEVELVDFLTLDYDSSFRNALLTLAKGESGGARELSRMNFALGEKMRDACLSLIVRNGLKNGDIAFVGSHGHTFYHEPEGVMYYGSFISSTLQLGESAVIAEALGCPVVSDFRVSDVACGGQGAPLVPYTEYILYGNRGVNYGLLNIGGIGNITSIAKNGTLSDVFAFDTGPGNMVIDALVSIFTGGRERFDRDGRTAAQGSVDEGLMAYLLDDEYLRRPLPKSTGRERYGEKYVETLLEKAGGMRSEDIVRTVTAFTAECVRIGIETFFSSTPEVILVSGGGASNPVLMRELGERLGTRVEKNIYSDSKEAVAFAILANERLNGRANNAPGATGARHPVVMGKVVIC